MIPSAISRKVLRSLGTLKYSSSDLPKRFSFSGTLKEMLTNEHIYKEVSVINSSQLEVIMDKSDYLSSLMTDIYFGRERIDQQLRNIKCQVEGGQQPAWVLVSTYYASYFLACDLAKLCGQFITNVPVFGVKQLLTQVNNGSPSNFSYDSDVSFSANVSPGTYENEIVIRLTKTASKPHKVAWTNFYGILRDVDVEKSNIRFERLKDIVDSTCERWRLPSTVRNEWNYSAVHYYGPKGNDIAKTFSSLINNPGSSFKVFGNNTLQPTEENVAASIVYLYDVLREAHFKTIKSVFPTE